MALVNQFREPYLPYKLPYRSVLMIPSGGVSDCRMLFALRALEQAGYGVETLYSIPYWKVNHHDLVICSRPNGDIAELLRATLRAGKPVILDMDDDFFSIPPKNPAYKDFGPGNGDYLRLMRTLVTEVTKLTVPMGELANRYKRLDAVIIPNGWDEGCMEWYDSELPLHRERFTVGWAGTATHLEDFQLALPALTQFFAETASNLVIGGDPDIYHLFDFMAPERRLFLGALEYKDYPLMYRYFDLLVAPLADTYFNQAKSDIKLVEAGARGIPWLASPVGPYLRWENVGGRLCNTTEQWLIGLKYFQESREHCRVCGAAGGELVRNRTGAKLGQQWLQLVEEVLNGA